VVDDSSRYGAGRAIRAPLDVVDASGALVGQIAGCARLVGQRPARPGTVIRWIRWTHSMRWTRRSAGVPGLLWTRAAGTARPGSSCTPVTEAGARHPLEGCWDGATREQLHPGWSTTYAVDAAVALGERGPGSRLADATLDVGRVNDPPATVGWADDTAELRSRLHQLRHGPERGGPAPPGRARRS